MAVSTNLGLYLPTREDYISVKRDLSDNYEVIDEHAGMMENGSAIVVNGDTASQAITSGQYLLIKNHSTLASGSYHATTNIANGATIDNSNVAIDANGLANALNTNFASYFSKVNHGAVADASNRNLIGMYFVRDTDCSGLPTSNIGWYYTLLAYGDSQLAIMYENGTVGSTLVYSRYYINNVWNGWQCVGNNTIISVYSGKTMAQVDADLAAKFGNKFLSLIAYTSPPSGETYPVGIYIVAKHSDISNNVRHVNLAGNVYENLALIDSAVTMTDITNSCTWNNGFTFSLKRAQKMYRRVYISISATASAFSNGAIVVTLPSGTTALYQQYLSGVVVSAAAIPSGQTAMATIGSGSNQLKLYISGASLNNQYIVLSGSIVTNT